ncbi:MAG: hypothetical protein KGV51_04485 [Moraxellaceae bacterium]|nr:hypothetical protein [Moraxellaceae bacterium]
MKPLSLAILASSLALTACSDEPKTQEQPITVQEVQPQQPTQQVEQQTNTNNSEPTKTANTQTTNNQAVSQKNTATNINLDTSQQVADANLQDELFLFTQSLDMISEELREQHKVIYEKEKQAKSRQDDDEIAKMTIKVLTQQKELLQATPLTSPQLSAIRDKYVQSAELAIEAHKEMISIRQPTAEDEKKLVAKFTQGKKLSDEAKKELQGLIRQVNKK